MSACLPPYQCATPAASHSHAPATRQALKRVDFVPCALHAPRVLLWRRQTPTTAVRVWGPCAGRRPGVLRAPLCVTRDREQEGADTRPGRRASAQDNRPRRGMTGWVSRRFACRFAAVCYGFCSGSPRPCERALPPGLSTNHPATDAQTTNKAGARQDALWGPIGGQAQVHWATSPGAATRPPVRRPARAAARKPPPSPSWGPHHDGVASITAVVPLSKHPGFWSRAPGAPWPNQRRGGPLGLKHDYGQSALGPVAAFKQHANHVRN